MGHRPSLMQIACTVGISGMRGSSGLSGLSGLGGLGGRKVAVQAPALGGRLGVSDWPKVTNASDGELVQAWLSLALGPASPLGSFLVPDTPCLLPPQLSPKRPQLPAPPCPPTPPLPAHPVHRSWPGASRGSKPQAWCVDCAAGDPGPGTSQSRSSQFRIYEAQNHATARKTWQPKTVQHPQDAAKRSQRRASPPRRAAMPAR